jgi:hypothetical protein
LTISTASFDALPKVADSRSCRIARQRAEMSSSSSTESLE